MRLDRERDRGNIDESTEIVNDGDYVGYAEAVYGPWDIRFEREREGSKLVRGHPEKLTVRGPFIGSDGGDGSDGRVETEVTIGTWSTVTDADITWDYVELADEEVFTPSDN